MKIFLAIFAALAISACSSTGHNKSGYMGDANSNYGYSDHMQTNNRKR